VIEFKHRSEDEKNLKKEALKVQAQKGLKQIEEKAYTCTLYEVPK